MNYIRKSIRNYKNALHNLFLILLISFDLETKTWNLIPLSTISVTYFLILVEKKFHLLNLDA
jgi:hypothetical protein